MNVVRLSALRTGRLYPPRRYSWYSFLWEAECGRKDCQWKIPMTPLGIEPATFRLVAQCLNQLRLHSNIFRCKIPGVRSPRGVNLLRWQPIFVGPQNGTFCHPPRAQNFEMAAILFINLCTADVYVRSEQMRVTTQCSLQWWHSVIISVSTKVSENTLLLENCALLGYYASSSGNFLPTFQYNL
jgi:hypothetical protein